MEGGTTPTSFPHRCPYQRFGASKNFCEETTASYQRNLAGCCGTNDSRAFAPCNSQWRKCVKCLSEGRGSKSNKVEDVARGLCEEHAEGAQTSAVSRPRQSTPAPKPVPRVVVAILTQPKVRVAASATETEARLEVMRNIGKNMQPASPKPCPVPPVVYVPPKRPEVSKPAWKPAPKSVVAAPVQKAPVPQLDIDACAARFSTLTNRDRRVVAAVMSDGRKIAHVRLQMKRNSLDATLSTICTKLGIPKSNRYVFYDRAGALRQVWLRYQDIGRVGEPLSQKPAPVAEEPTSVVRQRAEVSDMSPQERELLLRYRCMTLDQRALFLDVFKRLVDEQAGG